MTRISGRLALFCAALFLAGMLGCDRDADAQDKKDKQVEKKTDDKGKKIEKKTDDKGKKIEKKTDDKGKKEEKKEEKKKEEYKPDLAQTVLKGHKGWIFALAFAADGKALASSSRDRTVKVWDLAGKKEMQAIKGKTDEMKGLAYGGGNVMVTDGSFRMEKEKGKEKEKDKEKKVREYVITIADAKSGKEVKALKGHTDPIECLALDADGKTLYSGSADQTIKVWDLAQGKDVNTIKAHTASVMAIAVSKDSSKLASAGADGTVKIWDKAGKELAAFKVEKEVKTKDPKTKKEKVTKEPARAFTCVAFSPDGKRLAAGNNDGFVKLYDVDGKKEIQELQAHEGVWAVAYSPDGTLATGGYGGQIKLWDSAGKVLRTIKATVTPSSTVIALAFSPDGSVLVSGGTDELIKIWSDGGKK